MKSREGNIVYITEKSDCAGEHIAGCNNNTCDLTGSNVVQNYLLLYHCRMARMRSGTRIAYIYITARLQPLSTEVQTKLSKSHLRRFPGTTAAILLAARHIQRVARGFRWT